MMFSDSVRNLTRKYTTFHYQAFISIGIFSTSLDFNLELQLNDNQDGCNHQTTQELIVQRNTYFILVLKLLWVHELVRHKQQYEFKHIVLLNTL